MIIIINLINSIIFGIGIYSILVFLDTNIKNTNLLELIVTFIAGYILTLAVKNKFNEKYQSYKIKKLQKLELKKISEGRAKYIKEFYTREDK